MCHHTGDSTRERWAPTEVTDEEDPGEEPLEQDDDPSFVQDERDVDVELLEADDD